MHAGPRFPFRACLGEAATTEPRFVSFTYGPTIYMKMKKRSMMGVTCQDCSAS
jgi:hypothetical protein